jgi:two-component sensor histidine kinase
MHELSHRTKNLLAVIQALARQLMRSCTDTADFEQKFMARIQALARAHDLLVQQHWQGALLADVIGAQLWPFVGSERGRVALDGPPLMLRLEAVQNLSLVLHELATNASKYGALSLPTGTLAIGWRIDGDHLALTWREAGGPPVTPPTRRGFGHTIIERLLAQGLDSEVTLDYPPDGAQASLRIPVAQMVSEG